MPTVSNVTFTAAGDPGHRLEGLLHVPASPNVAGGCVLLPPHPMFGGRMETPLLAAVAQRLASDGWVVLRLNFRGVGTSEGATSDGTGEALDALGALAHLDGLDSLGVPCGRRALVGWSFGALAGLLVATHDAEVGDWVGIGPPARRLNALPIAEPPYDALAGWGARRSVIVGELDALYPPSTVATLRPDAVAVIAGADHFMADRGEEVAEAVARALDRTP